MGTKAKLKAGLAGDKAGKPPCEHRSGKVGGRPPPLRPPPGAWFAPSPVPRGFRRGDARGEAPAFLPPSVTFFRRRRLFSAYLLILFFICDILFLIGQVPARKREREHPGGTRNT